MKRLFCLILCLLLIIVYFAGCTEEKPGHENINSDKTIEASSGESLIDILASEYTTIYATNDDFRYNIENGAVTIWDYINPKRYTEKHNVVIPGTIEGYPVTTIDHHTFSSYALVGAFVPENVQSIGLGAFNSCLSLRFVSLPSTATEIDIYAFENCPNLEEIYIEMSNPVYTSLDGILYSKDITTLIKCPEGKTELFIPNGVTTILRCCDCDNLENIVISESVTTIKEGAFAGNDGITSIVIPTAVNNLEKLAFANCQNLVSVEFKASVISERCFQGCEIRNKKDFGVV